MRSLIETTIPVLAIIAIPITFYAGIILGSNISPKKNTTDSLTEQVFLFEEEKYIDDIPFDTKSIAECLNETKNENIINYTQETDQTDRNYHSTYPTIGLNDNLVIITSSF
jgi:predicted esterase YcpF (UPF0227 family)